MAQKRTYKQTETVIVAVPVEPAEILIGKRLTDYWIDEEGVHHPTYIAALAGARGVWGQGRSIQSAVGDLITAHPEQFGVKFTQVLI